MTTENNLFYIVGNKIRPITCLKRRLKMLRINGVYYEKDKVIILKKEDNLKEVKL